MNPIGEAPWHLSLSPRLPASLRRGPTSLLHNAAASTLASLADGLAGLSKADCLHAVAMLVAGMACVALSLHTTMHGRPVVYLWPASGVLLGLAAPQWRQSSGFRLLAFAAAFVSVALGGLLAGAHTAAALQAAVLSCVELALAARFLFPVVSSLAHLKSRRGVSQFALVAVFIPLCTSLLSLLTSQGHPHSISTLAHTILANALGMALGYPVLLMLCGLRLSGATVALSAQRPALLALTVFAGVATWTFWQDLGPFLFMVFPPMIVALLLLGLDGAVLMSLFVSIVGWVATTHGHGPMWLIRNATDDHRILILQLFVLTCIATAMPVGALLDQRRAAERKAEEARSIYETMLHNAEEMIVLSSIEGTSRYVSPAVERITGYTPEEYLALNRLETVHPADRDLVHTTLRSLRNGKREHTLRYRALQKEGGYRWAEAKLRGYGNTQTDTIAGYVVAVRDISELRQTEDRWQRERAELAREQQRLASLASTDSLTGLPNRRAFEELLSNLEFDMRLQAERTPADGRSAMAHRKLTVMMIDVDHFKLYNDTYGHAEGDACLAQLAAILRSTLCRRDDVVARLGGEEFAVVLPGAGHSAGPVIAQRLLEAVRAANRAHAGSPMGRVTVSIGIATGEPAADFSYAHLLQQADRALYSRKASGRDGAAVYTAVPA